MLIEYFPISSLTPEELQRLRSLLPPAHVKLEASSPVFMFEGKSLHIAEVRALQLQAQRTTLKG